MLKFKFFLGCLLLTIATTIYSANVLSSRSEPDAGLGAFYTLFQGLLISGLALFVDLHLLNKKSGMAAVGKAILQLLAAIALLVGAYIIFYIYG